METQPLEISDDALKLLVAEHGVRGTARLLQMDERQGEAFRKRVGRAGWMKEPAIATIRARSSPTNIPTALVPKLSPTAALATEIQALGTRSRVGFAKASASVAEYVAAREPEENLADASNVKSAAQVADLVFGWKESAPQVKIRLDVLSTQAEQPVFEVESEVVSAWEPSNNVDDY